MGRMSEVLGELEAIGAVGASAVVLRMESVEPAVRLVPPLESALSPDINERVRILRDAGLDSLRRLEILFNEVQDLRQVLTNMVELASLQLGGENDAEVHPEA